MFKKINIKGMDYKLSYKAMKNNSGECDREKKEIILNPEMSGIYKSSTFCHEFIHAVLYEVGLSDIIDIKIEELIAENCGTAMAKFINDKLKIKLEELL